MHLHEESGPPCRHIEPLLQGAADGSARGWKRWYALAHAARCRRCGTFLSRLEETLRYLRGAKRNEPSPTVVERLAQGEWREI